MKRKSVSALNKGLDQQARLLEELDKLSKSLDAAEHQQAQKEIEEKMSILHTALKKVEASIPKNDACLEESQIWEDEVCYRDQG